MCSVFKFQRSAIGRLFQARNPLVFLVCVRVCLFFEGGERASQPIQNSLLDRALSLPPCCARKREVPFGDVSISNTTGARQLDQKSRKW